MGSTYSLSRAPRRTIVTRCALKEEERERLRERRRKSQRNTQRYANEQHKYTVVCFTLGPGFPVGPLAPRAPRGP